MQRSMLSRSGNGGFTADSPWRPSVAGRAVAPIPCLDCRHSFGGRSVNLYRPLPRAIYRSLPSGDHAQSEIVPRTRITAARGVPSAFQVRAVLSPPAVASHVPSGAIATARTPPSWPVMVRTSASAAFQVVASGEQLSASQTGIRVGDGGGHLRGQPRTFQNAVVVRGRHVLVGDVGAEDIADRGGEGGQGERRSAEFVVAPRCPSCVSTATAAPWEASRRTIAAPIPRLPPVTKARLPSRLDVDVMALPVLSPSFALVRYRYYCSHAAAPMATATGARSPGADGACGTRRA
jgi:hypothetical protein